MSQYGLQLKVEFTLLSQLISPGDGIPLFIKEVAETSRHSLLVCMLGGNKLVDVLLEFFTSRVSIAHSQSFGPGSTDALFSGTGWRRDKCMVVFFAQDGDKVMVERATPCNIWSFNSLNILILVASGSVS
jgi:hypothetical protein